MISAGLLCLLSCMCKLLEKLVKNILEKQLEDGGGLHTFLHGFRNGRSLIDALKEVQKVITNIKQQAYKNREKRILITLDIKSAFNSADWLGKQATITDIAAIFNKKWGEQEEGRIKNQNTKDEYLRCMQHRI